MTKPESLANAHGVSGAIGHSRSDSDTVSDHERPRILKIAHSPDADDRLMFWALKNRRVVADRFDFEIVEADTQTLNQMALQGAFDIIAVSAAHYANLYGFYQPLRMGSSVGAGYGPVLVQECDVDARPRESFPIPYSEALKSWTLLTPGFQTTAHNALSALGYHFGRYVEVPIQPMSLTFDTLRKLCAETREKGDVPRVAALIIHEGRLTYQTEGTEKILDLGEQWKQKFSSNLPLGINVIKRSLPEKDREYLSLLLRQSMTCGLQNLHVFEQEYAKDGLLKSEALRQYLSMYANETTLDISADDKAAFELLLTEIMTRSLPVGSKDAVAVNCDWI